MKNTLSFFSIILMMLVFTACDKDYEKSVKDESDYEINLKSFEPDVTVKGGGEVGRYDKVILEELVKNPNCKYEVVAGIVEFYFEKDMVFSVHFGNGECDGLAIITWLKEDGSTHSREVDVWRLFKKNHGENEEDHEKCFVLVLPIDFIMPDGSSYTVEQKEDWRILRDWYVANPGYEENPAMQFPVDIQFEDGEIITVNNEREMLRYKEACEGEEPKLTKVITEELQRSEECNGEIVAGLIDFYDQERNWVFSIGFGNGECDGIATKCWINKKTQERECEDFNVTDWKPRP